MAPNKPVRIVIGTGLALVLIAGLAVGTGVGPLGEVRSAIAHLPEKYLAPWLPTRAGEPAVESQQDRQARRKLRRRLSGTLVWASNRGGNHDIWIMEVPDGEPRPLTDHPHVDYFARFSPDGSRILFLRSREEYVSGRDHTGWDLWIMERDGSAQRRLAERAFRPVWTDAGDAILFSRDREAFRVELDGTETRIFAPPPGLPATRQGEVHPSPDGRRLGAAVDSGGTAIWFIDGSEPIRLDPTGSCEVTWVRGEDRVLWVQNGGRGGTRIMTATPIGGEPEVLMDLPGERSHEYFPRVSNDGRWLVWAATATGHEHDRADYEIYAWEIGRPRRSATRLTHHTGNDNWPDLWVDES